MIAPLDRYWLELIQSQVEGGNPPPVDREYIPMSTPSGRNHAVLFNTEKPIHVGLPDASPGTYRARMRGPNGEYDDILRILDGFQSPGGVETIDMRRIR